MFDKIKKINLIKVFNLENTERQIIYIIVAVIFIVTNILISSFSLRLDLSFGKAYTLSSSTKKILKKLDDVINIKFFVSSDLPTRLLPLKTEVIDLLNEYKKENSGKVYVKILDPKKDQSTAIEAKELAIPELQFSQIEQDKYAVTNSYFGIALSYRDKKDKLPQVTNIDNLEYNLTASIYKMTRKEISKIGILAYGVDPQGVPYYNLSRLLSSQFNIRPIDISSHAGLIDTSYKAILVFDDNKKEYDEQEIKLLKDYLNKKGKAIFFVDGIWVLDTLTTTETKHNLSSLLDEYGIKIDKNLILSTSAEVVNFSNQNVSFFKSYPFWLKTNIFNSKTSYFSNIAQLVFPWTSSITLQKKPDVENIELVKSTKKSWEQNTEFTLNPKTIEQPQTIALRQFLLIAQAKNKNGGEIIVVPSSKFVKDQFLDPNTGNLEFVLNVLNNLVSGGALSGIRQRAFSFYPLPDISENEKDFFKYLNIFLLPALFGVYGTFRLLRRR